MYYAFLCLDPEEGISCPDITRKSCTVPEKDIMLLSQRSRPRCREVTGPTPHSVALKAKFPTGRPRDFLIHETRRKEEICNRMLAYAKENSDKTIRSNWERVTDHKIVHNMVQRKVYETMQEYKMHIEERRDRLKSLLENEETQHIKEMESMEETTLERQAKMRERARSLREKREKERLALVAEKREQQFREQCEELRSLRSRMNENEVCTERMAQLAVKEELEKQRKEEKELFDQLWEQDRLAKEEHEAKKNLGKEERIREMLEILNLQRSAANAQKTEEKRLKEEEAKLLEEQRQLMKLEDERALQEKKQKQTQVRHILDTSLRLKMKRLARDRQEELSLDMKIMEQIMKGTHDDTEEKHQRKLELKKEQQIYRKYLAQQLEEEKHQEKEMDKLIDAEVEKAWAKKAEQQRKEREARNRLMKDVMDTRQLQIKENLERNAVKQEELARERELLEKAIEEHKQLESEITERQRKDAKQYQQQLISQMAYQHQQHENEKEENWREYQAGLLAEKEYQEKLQETLSKPHGGGERVHPLRNPRISSPKDWLPQ